MSDAAAVTLTGERVAVTVLPGRGGELWSVRSRASDAEILWTSPSTGGQPPADLDFAGGWRTIFPAPTAVTGNPAAPAHGLLAGTGWERGPVRVRGEVVDIELRASPPPFRCSRSIAVHGNQVRVAERVTNVGPTPEAVTWRHHPTFGAPLLSGAASFSCGASTFVADAGEGPASDLLGGARSVFPLVAGRGGHPVDLRLLPGRSRLARMGYLTGFDRGWARIENPVAGLSCELEWDLDAFPHAWYWFESRPTRDLPWGGPTYCLAIEPASYLPGTIQPPYPRLLDVGATVATELRLTVEDRG